MNKLQISLKEVQKILDILASKEGIILSVPYIKKQKIIQKGRNTVIVRYTYEYKSMGDKLYWLPILYHHTKK